MADDTQQQVIKYQELLMKGVPAKDAFYQAFPNGFRSAQQRQVAAAKQQQQGALAQTGGLLGGVVGGKAIMDAVTGKPVFGGLFSGSGASAPVGVGPIADGSAYASEIPAAAATDTAAAAPSFIGSAQSIGPLAGIALTTALAGKAGLNMLHGKSDDSLAGKYGRLSLGIATGGLSEVGNKLGLWGQPSTRDIEKQHTNQLASQGKDDPAWQQYVGGMRQQYNAAPPDPSKPYDGKYASWDDYKKAGLQASDLTGVYGNMKTFGPDWAHLNFDQQQKVTQGLIDNNLYDSKKGEVVITDPTKAQQIKDQILGVQQQSTPQPSQQVQPLANTKYNQQVVKQNGQFGNQLLKSLGGS